MSKYLLSYIISQINELQIVGEEAALIVNRKSQGDLSTYGTPKGQEFLDEHDDVCLKFYLFCNGKC